MPLETLVVDLAFGVSRLPNTLTKIAAKLARDQRDCGCNQNHMMGRHYGRIRLIDPLCTLKPI
jgi:hypothetical protein